MHGWKRWDTVDELLVSNGGIYALVFILEADILSIWCKDDLNYYTSDDFFERLAASQVCRYSTIHSNVHVITALKAQSVTNFPRWHVFQVKSQVELDTVSLSVYSGTCPPIFTEIGSYMTDTEQKKCWHVFYWDMVVKLTVKVKLQ